MYVYINICIKKDICILIIYILIFYRIGPMYPWYLFIFVRCVHVAYPSIDTDFVMQTGYPSVSLSVPEMQCKCKYGRGKRAPALESSIFLSIYLCPILAHILYWRKQCVSTFALLYSPRCIQCNIYYLPRVVGSGINQRDCSYSLESSGSAMVVLSGPKRYAGATLMYFSLSPLWPLVRWTVFPEQSANASSTSAAFYCEEMYCRCLINSHRNSELWGFKNELNKASITQYAYYGEDWWMNG